MRREHTATSRRLHGLVERETVRDQFPDAFDGEESGVALVGVEDLRFQSEGP